MALQCPDWRVINAQMPLWKLLSDWYFRAEIDGWERLPAPPSLLISVHGGSALPVDAFVFVHSWLRRFGRERIMHGTAHDVLMGLPVVGDLFRAAGVIPASREGVTEALAAGHDVIVWPGGEEDAMRSWRKRDTAVLAGRHGFVTQAIRSRVPIVPVASVGGGDTVFVLSEGRRLADLLEKLIGLKTRLRGSTLPIIGGIPFGITPEILPVHLPLPAKLRYEILEPVEVETDPAAADDRDYVHDVYVRVESALQEGMDRLAAKRTLPVLG